MADLPAMSEAELERGVRSILADLPGVLGYHTRDSRGSSAGFPDWVFAGSSGVLFRELKTATGKLSRDQAVWIEALTDGGADAGVWRPADLRSGRVARELAVIASITRIHH